MLRKHLKVQMKKVESGKLKFSKKDFISTIERLFKPVKLGFGNDTIYATETGEENVAKLFEILMKDFKIKFREE